MIFHARFYIREKIGFFLYAKKSTIKVGPQMDMPNLIFWISFYT